MLLFDPYMHRTEHTNVYRSRSQTCMLEELHYGTEFNIYMQL